MKLASSTDPVSGKTWTPSQSEIDANNAAVAQHDALNTWLNQLHSVDPAQFEKVRRMSYSDQCTLANV